jgi:hypothetical protein
MRFGGAAINAPCAWTTREIDTAFRFAQRRNPLAEPATDGGKHEQGEAAAGAAEDAGSGQQSAPLPIALLYGALMLAAPDTDRTVVARRQRLRRAITHSSWSSGRTCGGRIEEFAER